TRAVGRYAAARGDLPRVVARSEPPADGRALRRARRDDARGDEPGATPHLGGATQDDSVRHAFHPRGDPAGRPRGRDDAAARPRRLARGRAPCRPGACCAARAARPAPSPPAPPPLLSSRSSPSLTPVPPPRSPRLGCGGGWRVRSSVWA